MRLAWLAVFAVLGGVATEAVAAPNLVRTFPNKMTVIVRENRTRPLVSIQAWINAGSRDETRSERGASSVLAYLPFESPAGRKPGELDKEVSGIGGFYSGEAGYSYIAYTINVPARHYGQALDVLGDALVRPTFNQRTVDQAIAKARRESGSTLRVAGGVGLNAIRSELFGDSPLGAPLRVPELEIAALTLPILQRFYKENYLAENLTVVVVGDVDAEAAAAQIAEKFKDMPRVGTRSKPRAASRSISGPVYRWISNPAGTEGTVVTAGFRGPQWGTADAVALDVLMALLVDSPTSRLQRRLQEGTGEYAAAVAHRSFTPDGGIVSLTITMEPGRMKDAEAMLAQEVEKARSQPVTAEEHAAAINSILAREASSLADLRGLARAAAIAYSQGRPGADEVYIQRLKAVRPEDLTAVARKYLDWKNGTIVEVMSQQVADSLGVKKDFEKRFGEKISLYQGTYRPGPQATASTDEARRSRIDQPLAAIPSAPFDPGRGRVERTTLAGGLRLLTSEDKSAPGVTIGVYLSGGVRYENDKNNGITSLLRETMFNSTDPKLSGRTYRQSLLLMGSLVPYQDRDMWGASLAVPSSNWKEALQRIGSMLAHPDLDSVTVDATRILQLTALDKWMEDDDAQRQRLILSTKYTVSGYRLPGLGNRLNVISIPNSAMEAFHKKFVVKPNLVVAVFGDVKSSEVTPAVEEAFRDVSAAPFAPGRIPKDLPFPGFREKWELGAGSITTVQLAFNGPPASSPDVPVLHVVNSVFSGPNGWFSKYLMTEDYVDGATSFVAQAVDESPIIATVNISGPVREEEGTKLLFRQFKKVAGLPMTGPELAPELRAAKVHAVGTFLALFTSNTSRAFQWARAEVFGLPPDYIITLPSKMDNVSADDIIRIGDRYFQKGDWERQPYAVAETRPGGW